MSRLQVGGLALIIKGRVDQRNVGKVVELVAFDGSDLPWKIFREEGLCSGGSIKQYTWITADRLMPLGDKQTQDELAKEREREFN